MAKKGSFIGFTFGNRHSSTLGILRTSSSDRYTTILSPESRDITVQLETRDGQYYWNSNYTKREISIPFAFYGMTNEQLKEIKQIFNDKKIHSLILDEEPYKVWSAKLTGTTTMSTICFENGGTRFYCGEGTFIFQICYPYARSRYQYEEDYSIETIPEWTEGDPFFTDLNENEIIRPSILSYDLEHEAGAIIGYEKDFIEWLDDIDLLVDSDSDLVGVNSVINFFKSPDIYFNKNEWLLASQIPSKDKYGAYLDNKYVLFNAGDVDMPFKIYFEVNSIAKDFDVSYDDNHKISLKNVVAQGQDKYIVLDTSTLTIQGCDQNYKKTKNLYNKYIASGNLFSLPVGEIELITPEASRLEFNYLYL